MSRFTTLQQRAFISVIAALLVHVVVIAVWILLLMWDLPIFSIESQPEDAQPEPDITVVLQPMVKMPPKLKPQIKPVQKQLKKKPKAKELTKKQAEKKKTKPIQPPKQPKPPKLAQKEKSKPKEKKRPLREQPKQKKKYVRTSAEQAGTPDQKTDLIGERDTLAASDRAPTPGADPNKPSQDGVDSLYKGQVETVSKNYKDGSVGMDKTGKETETPQESTLARNNQEKIDEAPKVEVLKPKEETASSAMSRNKHLAKGKFLPAPDDGKGKKMIQDKPKADELPKARPNKGQKKIAKGKEINQSPKKDGFSGFSRKNKITGSISRRGKSALNVKNSPLGRYQALISKAVELKWRRNCEKHRDYIVPGVISVRFYVDVHGKVSGVKFQEVIEGNYIEQGFTQRAIRQAKIPKMPKSVVRELKGEPLELIYNFYF